MTTSIQGRAGTLHSIAFIMLAVTAIYALFQSYGLFVEGMRVLNSEDSGDAINSFGAIPIALVRPGIVALALFRFRTILSSWKSGHLFNLEVSNAVWSIGSLIFVFSFTPVVINPSGHLNIPFNFVGMAVGSFVTLLGHVLQEADHQNQELEAVV